MRLSITLGIDIDVIEEWPMSKVQRYLAHYLVEPFGNSWNQAAMITNVIANCLGRGKNQPAYRVEDWLPVKQEQTVDEMHSAFLAAVGNKIQ